MESGPATPRERRRVKEASQQRRRKASLLLGASGLILLFGSAIATIGFREATAILASLMVVGVGLLVVALALIRSSPLGLVRRLEK